MHAIRLSIACILLSLAAVSAQAMSITWEFQNAIFDDGTSLDGSFDFALDGGVIDTGAFSNVDINTYTSPTTGMSGQHYDSVNVIGGQFGLISATGSTLLAVFFNDALNSVASLIEIAGGAEMSGTGMARELLSGQITSGNVISGDTNSISLTEPSIIIMVLMGLVAVFLLRRRAVI